MNQNVSLPDMNRRSFFGFFPAAAAGAVLGVPAVKTAWGEGIPEILKGYQRADKMRGFFADGTEWRAQPFRGRGLTLAERAEFQRVFIDPALNQTPAEAAEVEARLIDCVGRYCLGLPQKAVS